MRKWWAKLLLIIGAAMGLACLFVATSSIHSRNSVDAYKDRLRASGEKLDIKDLIPPLPDPASNGVTLLNDACRYLYPGNGPLESNAPAMMQMVSLGKAVAGWQQDQVVSVYKSHLITNSWDEVETAMQPQAAALDLLRQAAERPQLDFGLDYEHFPYISVTHWARLKGAILVLSYEAADALHRGNSAEAVTNIHTMVNLVGAWNEPILPSQSMRNGMTFSAMYAQWGLLQATNLTDEQLALLQRDWTSLDFITPLEKGMTMMRAWTCVDIERWRGSNSPSAAFAGTFGSMPSGGSGDWLDDLKNLGNDAKQEAVDALWRVSWSYSDELTIMKADQVLVETARRIGTNDSFQDAFLERDRRFAALGLNRTNRLYAKLTQLGPLSVEELSPSLDRLLVDEVLRSLTVTSIALKRYQLRHGEWPPDLKALVPEFLPEVPRDPVDGRPLRFHRNPDKTFTLYSIGKDGVDNGGDPARPAKSLTWQNGRDWVWPQPATPQEVRSYYEHPPR